MTRTLATALTAVALLAPATRADAGFILIGNTPSSELSVPFGVGSDGGANPSTRYEQVYNAALFGATPINISTLSFYAQGVGSGGASNAVTYQVHLSTTAAGVGGLDPVNFDANRGADDRLFATLSLSGNAPPVLTINGTTPFRYDPKKGNLLLDIVVPSQVVTSNIGASFDGFSGGFGTAASVAQNFDNTLPTASGLTTGIVFTAVPEPSTFALLSVAGLAASAVWARRRARRS